jgi:hypothetical protein
MLNHDADTPRAARLGILEGRRRKGMLRILKDHVQTRTNGNG